MNKTELYNEVLSYIAHAQLWHRMRTYTPSLELNDLLVGMMEAEGKVVRHFGLPETLQFTTPLQFLALKEDFELGDIKTLLEELEQEAICYFAGPVLTDLQILEKAKRERLNIDDVLAALSHPVRADAELDELYHEQFLNGRISAEALLSHTRMIAIKGYPIDTITNDTDK